MKYLNLKNDLFRFALIGISLSIILMLSSCADGHVTRNGIFQDHHKKFKKELIGQWRVLDSKSDIVGPVIYNFYTDSKGKVNLKVNDQKVEMRYFDSYDQLSFSFHFFDQNKRGFYVFGKFNTSKRQELTIHQSVQGKDGYERIEASLTSQESFRTFSKVIASNQKQ